MDSKRLIALLYASNLPLDARADLVRLVRAEQSAAERRQERDRLICRLGEVTGQHAEPWRAAGKILAWFQLWPRHRWRAIRTRGLQPADTAPFPTFVADQVLRLYQLTDGDLPTSQKQIHRILTDRDISG